MRRPVDLPTVSRTPLASASGRRACALFLLSLIFLVIVTPAAMATASPVTAASDQRETHAGESAPANSKPAEHSLSQKAVEIGRPLGFPITNSMVVTWIVALALILFARTGA